MDVDRGTVLLMLTIVGLMTMNGSVPASAEEIYKSVDQTGQVTYSAVPRADAVTTKALEPLHQPTPEEVSAAEQQQQLIKTFGAELEQNRKQREEEQARQAAAERVQQDASQLAIVYLPVTVFVGPIHPLSNQRGLTRLKRESRGLSEPPRFLRSEISRPHLF